MTDKSKVILDRSMEVPDKPTDPDIPTDPAITVDPAKPVPAKKSKSRKAPKRSGDYFKYIAISIYPINTKV